MFLTLHQKFANMSPTLFRSRRRPSHGRRPRRRCVRASPRLPADQSLRRAPARSGTLCLSRERIRTARHHGACFASKLCLINCAAFPQPRSTDRRSPPSSETPAGGATVSDAESRSSRCRLGILLHLLLHTVCSYDPLRNIACEIDSRHASLAVFRAFAKNRPTQARRTNTLPAHLPCSYEASFTARSPALSRPPPAFGRCARRLSVLPRRPPAPRAFPWSRTRRADCLFFLRAVVGWISLARAGVARRASSTIVFAAPSRGWFLSPPRSVGSLAARVASRAATAPGAPRRGPIIPRERRLFRWRLVVPVPDRRSGFCPPLVAAIEN